MLAALLLAAPLATWAQGSARYPVKPVRLVVPSPPSGGTDLIARLSTQKVSELWGQPVVVDNIAGGGTRIGVGTVARAAPDGYTLLLATTAFVFAPAIYSKLPYDPATDFTPIVRVANSADLLAVHPSLPAKTIRQLVDLARAHPDELRYGYGGAGSVGHLVGALFASTAHVRFLNVPYKGTGPSVTALLSGEIQVVIVNLAVLQPHVQSGRLRGLAVAGATRSPVMPSLPTVAEAGVPGFEYSGWYGLWAPAKTPPPLIARINEDFNRALADPTIKERLTQAAIEPVGGGSAPFAAYVASELHRWAKLAKDMDIKAE